MNIGILEVDMLLLPKSQLLASGIWSHTPVEWGLRRYRVIIWRTNRNAVCCDNERSNCDISPPLGCGDRKEANSSGSRREVELTQSRIVTEKTWSIVSRMASSRSYLMRCLEILLRCGSEIEVGVWSNHHRIDRKYLYKVCYDVIMWFGRDLIRCMEKTNFAWAMSITHYKHQILVMDENQR